MRHFSFLFYFAGYNWSTLKAELLGGKFVFYSWDMSTILSNVLVRLQQFWKWMIFNFSGESIPLDPPRICSRLQTMLTQRHLALPNWYCLRNIFSLLQDWINERKSLSVRYNICWPVQLISWNLSSENTVNNLTFSTANLQNWLIKMRINLAKAMSC